MRILNTKLSGSEMVTLHGEDWLLKQRKAGKITAQTLSLLQNEVAKGTSKSLLELNNLAEEFIISAGGVPTFKNYKGFPAGVCISVNKQMVHGIPNDYHLKDGDLVSFDLGVTIEGAIADSAITCIYGNPKSNLHSKVVQATEEALMRGIKAISLNKRLGCIGYAINRYAKGEGLSVITQYGGHSLTWNTPHASPFVTNKSQEEEGIRIQPGLTLAIEPMLTSGSTRTWVDKDGWTVYCDAEISAHFEHTIFVHQDYIEIITDRNHNG